MYKIDRRGGARGGSKNRSLGIYQKKLYLQVTLDISNESIFTNV